MPQVLNRVQLLVSAAANKTTQGSLLTRVTYPILSQRVKAPDKLLHACANRQISIAGVDVRYRSTLSQARPLDSGEPPPLAPFRHTTITNAALDWTQTATSRETHLAGAIRPRATHSAMLVPGSRGCENNPPLLVWPSLRFAMTTDRQLERAPAPHF
ncbi:hypothetical protein LIA77_01826 [Sarocladium implicatum]|nr:hypothetical protein LIA77_01826 [Sarocladium implicatum]